MISLQEAVKNEPAITALLYCPVGVGKSTTLGIIAGQTEGRTLVLDVDRTFINAMRKLNDAEALSKVDVIQIDNINTFKNWTEVLKELDEKNKAGKLNYENICVDNISELERCILSDLGAQGKNKGVPAQADYQYMQFKLVNSLRFMKAWGKNLYMTAWEEKEAFTHIDGTQYTMVHPKINKKVMDNICGLCDIVARIGVNAENERGMWLAATQNIYAKNQVDAREFCLVRDFIKKEEK